MLIMVDETFEECQRSSVERLKVQPQLNISIEIKANLISSHGKNARLLSVKNEPMANKISPLRFELRAFGACLGAAHVDVPM